jgi:amino acid adenylation domain-containing protein
MNVLQEDSTATDKRRRLAELLIQQSPAKRPSIEHIPRRATISPPLSFAQQRLWFLDKLVPESPFYNVPVAIRVRAPLDLEALRRTLNEIVRRHEVLRTSFLEVANRPVQAVGAPFEVPFSIVDLRTLDDATREQAVLRMATEDAQRPFDLRQGPLIRTSVLWLGPQDYVFLLNLHHIAADGWSMGVLVEEIQKTYGAFLHGKPSPLPDLAIQYADFAVWQHERLTTGGLHKQLNYWAAKLADLPILELPTDFPRRTMQGFGGETLYITLPRPLSDELKAFSRRHNVTLFMTLLAGFNALLHRYSGQDEIVIGEPVANRNRLELEPLIGFFVNSLVLRTDVSGDPSFRELLRRSRQVALEADENQDIPFEVLVERLRPERTMGRNPLFQVSLQFFSGSETKDRRATLPAELIHVEKGTASLDLAFDLVDSTDGILARVEYSTELYRRETIERMVRHYRNLLQAFVRDPELRLSKAPMLEADEWRQCVVDWNPPIPAHPFVHVVDLIQARVAASPDCIAVECDERRLTYRELGCRVAAWAGMLRQHGVGPETVVALAFGRSIEMIVGVLAIWEAGGAYLPLDPDLPDERARFLLADAKPRLILTTREQADRVQGWSVPALYYEDAQNDETACGQVARSGAENLAYVIYTSGSRGVPKGVMVEHAALSRQLAWMQSEFPLSPQDHVLFKYAVSFDVSLLEMICPLIAGARIIVLGDSGPVDIANLAALIRRSDVTVLDTVPSMLAALLEQPAFAQSRALRRIICGGEVMPATLLSHLRERLQVEFINMYGPTEATISATFFRADQAATTDWVPIGRPGEPYTAYVLDGHLNPVPVGVSGELCLGGPCLARGYLGRSELTAEKFVRDPFSPRTLARLYRTGDRCLFRPDGTLEFLGRVDDQVKVRGYRIELGDVEAALGDCPMVRSCAVAVRYEREHPELVAYVVPNTGGPEFWPSVGEYFVYDELLYHVMTTDRVRMQAYRSAIERVVRGKIVVDVGTGADLALARLCLDAGSKHVYAVEGMEDAYRRACRLAEDMGLGDRLTVLHGSAREISLPEQVDVCVSELIGTIGSSEGVVNILNDARRFLRPDGEMIPHRCVTRIAAVSLPEPLVGRPTFGEIPRYYVEKVFSSLGRRFDIRLCVKNLPASSIVSDTAVFEELSFDRAIPPEQFTEIELTVNKDGRVDGLLAWVNLSPGPEELIDVLTSECSWLPIFLPIFPTPLALQTGDTIRAVCARLDEPGEPTPNYLLRGVVSSRAQGELPFMYESRRNETAYRATPLYAALFDDAGSLADKRTPVPERGRVAEWREVYEQLYGGAGEGRDRDFDIVGWNSSYSGEPLAVEEMREQVEGTVARIVALRGRRVLEIGCGTGLLLLRLAGDADRYVGSDFSATALTALRARIVERGWQHVELWEREADDFSGIAPGSFDVVVLNSVVQYFPSMDYLIRVLAGALAAVGPQGSVFVGDVRSLPLLRLLHAGIELVRAGAGISVGELRERMARRLRQEQELVIDPAFFVALPERLAGCAGVAVQVKRGWQSNELTRFRYDVVLQGTAAVRMPAAVIEQDWATLGSVEGLRGQLASAPRSALQIRDMPNARVTGQWHWLEQLDEAAAGSTVQSLGAMPAAGYGIEPEQLWGLSEEFACDIQVGWADGDAARCDVLCVPRAGDGAANIWSLPPQPAAVRPWSAYANAPARPATQQHLTEVLRQHLRAKLPDYMIPTSFVWLDALPLTSHGKLNRNALPAPQPTQISQEQASIPPRTPLQHQIAAVWSEVLGVNGIGINTNFFNIGGHSLLATQVISRLGDRLDMGIPLRLMFEQPTIGGFADAVEELQAKRDGARTIPPIVPAKLSDPVEIDPGDLSDEQVDALLASLLAKGGGS